ncbi:polysaccharide biosynthesis tyrosine autokinase [Klenkia sp. PcliD-1-E]|nr:polysaccharide biosynthesis tyrosine autokinase [Klenkia sp. PcliD-1-E]
MIIVLAAVLGNSAAAGITYLLGPSYSSTLQFFVKTTGSATTSDAFQGAQYAEQRVASYTELLTGAELAQRVVDEVDVAITPERVQSDIDATTVTGTVLIDVTITDGSADVVAQIAAAVADQFPQQIAELETTEDDPATVMVSTTDDPSPPVAADVLLRNTGFGLVMGLLIGVVIAVTRALLDRSVRDKDQVEALVGAPVTGTVFRDGGLERDRGRGRPTSSRTTESYRQLAASLQYLDVDNPPKVMLVVSSVPAEGKTTTVVELARALAESGARVVVVEADLRRPRVVEHLDLVGGPGLTNVLAGKVGIADVTQVAEPGMDVIGSGPTPPHPGRLLGSEQMVAFLAHLRDHYDFVLVDAAPLLPVADSRRLAALVDGVLLTVRFGRTTADQLTEASTALSSVGARILGVVLTMVPPNSDLAQALAYGEDYGYDGAPVVDPATEGDDDLEGGGRAMPGDRPTAADADGWGAPVGGVPVDKGDQQVGAPVPPRPSLRGPDSGRTGAATGWPTDSSSARDAGSGRRTAVADAQRSGLRGAGGQQPDRRR